MQHPSYRADVDGLRAIAVLAVIAFHLFPATLRGGFIGVDIFFVISGFLISTIIFQTLDHGTFSISEFYTRRIKRIFPALLLVLGTCLSLGWFVLLADEYKQLGLHTAAGAAFFSNIMFWRESGYFDTAAESKPLLHLWSLGVEEQFYILWPLMIWLCWRYKNRFLPILLVLILLSFGLSIVGLKKDAAAMFFLPHVRFWELLVGALTAHLMLYNNSRLECTPLLKADLRAWLGLFLVGVGMFAIHKQSLFPGLWALLPVLGSTLLISAGAHAWINSTLLSHRVLVWFGLISYPLYLWHWPVLFFMRINLNAAPVQIGLCTALLSVALAWLTYRFVERPIRRNENNALKRNTLLGAMMLVGIAGFAVHQTNGFPRRALQQYFAPYTQSIAMTDKSESCFEIPYAYKKENGWFCTLGSAQSPPKLFAYGDSHALSLIPALEKLASQRRYSIPFTGTSGCPPLLGIQSLRGENWTEKYNCQKLNERIFAYVRDHKIPAVLLIARWSYYTGGTTHPEDFNAIVTTGSDSDGTRASSQAALVHAIQHTIKAYQEIDVSVYLMEDNPQQIQGPNEALRKIRVPSDTLINTLSVSRQEHQNNQKLATEILRANVKNNAVLIATDDILCDAEMCPLVRAGKFLYRDADHLSIEGALSIYPRLRTTLPAN